MKTALLVIDVQRMMFANPARVAHEGQAMLAAIRSLQDRVRAAGVPVIAIKHAGPEGTPIAEGGPLHPIMDEVAPQPGEAIFTKRTCSSFLGTGLKSHLEALGISRLVICGMQTDYCVDTSVRAGVEHGFQVVVASGAHATYDGPAVTAQQIVQHHEAIWAAMFGRVIAWEDVSFDDPIPHNKAAP
jgi:nicotinamidase-related amidase